MCQKFAGKINRRSHLLGTGCSGNIRDLYSAFQNTANEASVRKARDLYSAFQNTANEASVRKAGSSSPNNSASKQIEDALNSIDTSSENIEEVVAEDCLVNNMSAASEDIISSKNESAKNLQVR